MHGQPFLGHVVKRQCGVLYLAAEGEEEVRLRIEALMRTKYGNPSAVPFLWYETAPTLLQPGAVDRLVAMAEQAEQILQSKFGLPLGLLILDTIAASAGYSQPGAENDAGVGQALMNVLKTAAPRLSCFCLGVDHFGKNLKSGTRGASSKEGSADLILACLGDREVSGQVRNTRLAVRKCRGGVQGYEVPFTTRVVEHEQRDEDGDPVTTLVIDWDSKPPGPDLQRDPWRDIHRSDQRGAALRLKKVLMAVLAGHGVNLPTGPDCPTVRMVDREIVRLEFYAQTPADGTPEQKASLRRQAFRRTVEWAQEHGLIGVREIDAVTYLWLTAPHPEKDEA